MTPVRIGGTKAIQVGSTTPEEDGVEVSVEEGEESITNPWDPSENRFDTRPFTIDLLTRRIREGEIDLAPDFQRKASLWTPQQKSRLIESLLIKIPLPAFYFDASNEASWLVVDGLQRLSVLNEFILGSMKLEKMEFLSRYDGKNWKSLPRPLQRRIEESQVTVHLVLPGTPPEVKFNIFKRINTGGLILTGQEIRHALNQGAATVFLAELARDEAFLKATDFSIKPDRMVDREFVLRFLSFTITRYSDYKVPDMDAFLNAHMAKLNAMSSRERDKLQKQFRTAMTAARMIFGRWAFRKQYYEHQNRTPINKALFETWSVMLGKLQDDDIAALAEHRSEVMQKARDALTSAQFEKAISVGTQDVGKVRKRFSVVESIIKEALETFGDR